MKICGERSDTNNNFRTRESSLLVSGTPAQLSFEASNSKYSTAAGNFERVLSSFLYPLISFRERGETLEAEAFPSRIGGLLNQVQEYMYRVKSGPL